MASLRVGDWLVTPTLNEIQRDEEAVHIEPRSMEVLQCLAAAETGTVVSKEEIIRAVWRDAFVSDEVLTHAIWELRKALGDDARDPRYIQTIPKRGYRLLVPAEETSPSEPSHQGMGRRLLEAAPVLMIVAIVAAGLILYNRSHNVETESRRQTSTSRTLPRLLLQAPDNGGLAGEQLRQRFEPASLEPVFGGMNLMQVVLPEDGPPENWPRRASEDDHALVVHLPANDLGSVRFSLRSLLSRKIVYTFEIPLEAATKGIRVERLLAERVRAFADVNALPEAHNPHLQAWFDWSRHTPDAIKHFLAGVGHTLRGQSGSWRFYDQAIEADPGFLAPRIWRTTTLATEEERAAHLEALLALRDSGSGFENAMTEWAIALLRGDFQLALTEIELANHIVPENGPVLIVLAHQYAGFGRLDEAFSLLESLVDDAWEYAPVYPQAATYAVLLGALDRAGEILTAGRSNAATQSIDNFALAAGLAIWDGDWEAAERFRLALDNRIDQLQDRDSVIQVHGPLGHLSQRARDEGLEEAARRLDELIESLPTKG